MVSSVEEAAAAEEEAKANASLLVNTLHQLADKQNMLVDRIERIEQEIVFLKEDLILEK